MSDPVPRDCLLLFWGNYTQVGYTDWADFEVYSGSGGNAYDKYLQGWGTSVNPGDTGGSSTHTHTVGSHSHTGDAHTHTASAASGTGSPTVTISAYTDGLWSNRIHTHESENHTAVGISYVSQSTTWAATNNPTPPYIECILIRPKTSTTPTIPPAAGGLWALGGPAPYPFCPLNGVHFWYDPILNTYGPTPDCRAKMLKTAASGDTGARDSGGGITDHSHTEASGHTHTCNAHDHTNILCGFSVNKSGKLGGSGAARTSKHHEMYTTSTVQDSPDTSYALSSSQYPDPPAYIRATIVANQYPSTAAPIPLGLILPYIGDLESLPSNWVLCNGTDSDFDFRDRQVFVSSIDSDDGDTGGANTHNHGGTTATHTHTHSSTHTHTTYAELNTNDSQAHTSEGGASSMNVLTDSHGHTWTTGAATPTIPYGGTATISSADHRLPWYAVAWVQYKPSPKLTLKGTTTLLGQIYMASTMDGT